MPGTVRDTPPRRVMVVEDHVLIGELLAEMIEDLGHKVCGIARTHETAVLVSGNLLPDLIIIDAHLGQGSGLSAMDEIVQRAYVAHIFMSGDIALLRALRPNGVLLCKPFDSAELQQGIDRALHALPPAFARLPA